MAGGKKPGKTSAPISNDQNGNKEAALRSSQGRKGNDKSSPSSSSPSRIAASWALHLLPVLLSAAVAFFCGHYYASLTPQPSSPLAPELLNASVERNATSAASGATLNSGRPTPTSLSGSLAESSSSSAPPPHTWSPLVSAVSGRVATNLEARLSGLLEDTFSEECADLVVTTFETYATKSIKEDWLPFENERLPGHECKLKAPRLPPEAKVDAKDVRLVYLLLVHEQAFQTIRLVESLWEPQHHFLIHVDNKPQSHSTHAELKQWEGELKLKQGVHNVHLLPDAYRTNVSWGGFQVVQATLNAFHAVIHEFGLDFNWLVTMSGYTYPLRSNADIRARLSEHPLDTNFFQISPQPNAPAPRTWHHFVECDHAMRRVWRLATPHGTKMYAGSQWFVASKQFVAHLAPAATAGWTSGGSAGKAAAAHAVEAIVQRARSSGGSKRDKHAQLPPPTSGGDDDGDGDKEEWDDDGNARGAAAVAAFKLGIKNAERSFAVLYARYGKNTMVADENFFSTVLKNSAFCHTHLNFNFVHVQFDQWEHEKPTHKADPSKNKCLMPNPNHCGRSPTVTTLEYLPVLDLANTLFARKFDPDVDATVLDAIDTLRSSDVESGACAPAAPATSHPNPAIHAAMKAEALLEGSSSLSTEGGSSDDAGGEDDDSCMDLNASCRGWASVGECLKNPAYMRYHCPFSCGTCKPKMHTEEAAASTATSAAAAVVKEARKLPPKVNFLADVVITVPSSASASSLSSAAVGGGWKGLLCLELGATSNQKVKLNPCAPETRREQRLDLGPCSQDGHLEMAGAGGSAERSGGDDDGDDKGLDVGRSGGGGGQVVRALKGVYAQPFCLIKSVDKGNGACLDVEREQVKTGAKIITWACQKTKWNQLYSFDANTATNTTSIFINIPFAHHRDKKMCLEASTGGGGWAASGGGGSSATEHTVVSVGSEVRLAPCEAGNLLQAFNFYYANASPHAAVTASD